MADTQTKVFMGEQPQPEPQPEPELAESVEWVLTWDGNQLRSDMVLTAQVCTVAEILETTDWSVISPAGGPRQLSAWIAVLIVTVHGGDLMEEVQKLMLRPMAELTDALEVR